MSSSRLMLSFQFSRTSPIALLLGIYVSLFTSELLRGTAYKSPFFAS